MNVSICVLDSSLDSTYKHIDARILSTYSAMHRVRRGKGLHLMDSFNQSSCLLGVAILHSTFKCKFAENS